ncbi:hypothetical protein MBLNU230_g1986t1 [Neophaeotheca triangularis]
MADTGSSSAARAAQLDASDPLREFRELFIIPTRRDLKRKTLSTDGSNGDPNPQDEEPCTYLCGNSLGLQPKLTQKYMQQYLSTWATKGVFGHFTQIQDSNLPPWLHVDDDILTDMSTIVGAKTSEIAVMQTLTANLHLMMASFYRPTPGKFKILLEGKAFPSDHYAVESHIRHHGLDPAEAMVLLEPPSPASSPTLPTEHILALIDQHAPETALILLPGVQFYTGQALDIATITAHARAKNIPIGWDLAHAVGNVPLALHDDNVDFAVWCSYKYLNSGPGSIGGAFVHERHGDVASSSSANNDDDDGNKALLDYRPRLAGWWGSSKSSRFAMTNAFEPRPGAAGFQLSNPSVADMTALRASLDVFKRTSMAELRAKSVALTGFLEVSLESLARWREARFGEVGFEILTPRREGERGAQLSLRLGGGLLGGVMGILESEGVVVDERRPDVVRVAPAPLYNGFGDVERFVRVFGGALEQVAGSGAGKGSVMT